LSLGYPKADLEETILVGESAVEPGVARRLVGLAGKVRQAGSLGLSEVPSTRLLVHAARLIESGLPPRQACDVAIVQALTDEVELQQALRDLVALVF
jgi:nitric oxide reductase NorQ protein